MNASINKPSEHPPHQEEKLSKYLDGNVGYKKKNSRDSVVVAPGQQHNIGEKPTVMLYTYAIAFLVHKTGQKSTLKQN